jgi:hypothetical protein
MIALLMVAAQHLALIERPGLGWSRPSPDPKFGDKLGRLEHPAFLDAQIVLAVIEIIAATDAVFLL